MSGPAPASVLVAGIGNIFLGDDGFGCAVAQRLAQDDLPAHVTVKDFGIGGVHLAYELLDGYGAVILVDTVRRDGPAGTVYVIEPDTDDGLPPSVMDAHGLDPATMLGLVADLGGHVDQVVLVGLEPAELEEGIGLSAVAEAAVDAAVTLVRQQIERLAGRATAPAGKEAP